MKKEDNQVLKGVAIGIMVFYHLFYQLDNAALCYNLIMIKGTPFVTLLARGLNPVPFFIILSGYGFYKMYEGGCQFRFTRVLKLYVHYWITLLIFVPLACMLGFKQYPGDIWEILGNLSAWSTTYNGETWFILPYAVTAIASPGIFRAVNRLGSPLGRLCLVGATGLLYFSSYLIIHLYGNYLYYHMFAYLPILFLEFLFPFVLGMELAACNGIERRVSEGLGNIMAIVLLLALICIRSCIETGVFQPVFSLLFILIFNAIRLHSTARSFLAAVGKRATSIWLIHTWFCYYLFHNFIYSLGHPLVVFGVTIFLSYLSSLLIDKLRDFTFRFLNLQA